MSRFFDGSRSSSTSTSTSGSSSPSSSPASAMSTAAFEPNEVAFDVPTASALAQRFKDSISGSRRHVAMALLSGSTERCTGLPPPPWQDEVDEVNLHAGLNLMPTASLSNLTEPTQTHSLAASGQPLGAASRLAREHQGTLIITVLLEKMCALAMQQPQESRRLFRALVRRLARMGVISEIPAEKTDPIREVYGEAFEMLFRDARAALQHSMDSRTPHEPRALALWQPRGAVGSPQEGIDMPQSRFRSEFEEENLLGTGGFGSVVCARNRIDGSRYAIKKVPVHRLSHCHKILREVQTLARLDHPRVVRYHAAWFETAGSFDAPGDDDAAADVDISARSEAHDSPSLMMLYIQMQLCHHSLHDWLQARDQRCHKRATEIFRQLLEGVAYLHAQQLMHRDLKPRNVFLLADAGRLHVRLGDFGLARGLEMARTPPPASPAVLDPHATEPLSGTQSSFDLAVQHTVFSSGVGTTTYAAPEQLLSTSYDHRCDIYSLGIILFELLLPFGTEMERQMELSALKQGTLPDTFIGSFPTESARILLMTSEDPANRPSAKELLEGDLSLFLAGPNSDTSENSLEMLLQTPAPATLQEAHALIAQLKEALRARAAADEMGPLAL